MQNTPKVLTPEQKRAIEEKARQEESRLRLARFQNAEKEYNKMKEDYDKILGRGSDVDLSKAPFPADQKTWERQIELYELEVLRSQLSAKAIPYNEKNKLASPEIWRYDRTLKYNSELENHKQKHQEDVKRHAAQTPNVPAPAMDPFPSFEDWLEKKVNSYKIEPYMEDSVLQTLKQPNGDPLPNLKDTKKWDTIKVSVARGALKNEKNEDIKFNPQSNEYFPKWYVRTIKALQSLVKQKKPTSTTTPVAVAGATVGTGLAVSLATQPVFNWFQACLYEAKILISRLKHITNAKGACILPEPCPKDLDDPKGKVFPSRLEVRFERVAFANVSHCIDQLTDMASNLQNAQKSLGPHAEIIANPFLKNYLDAIRNILRSFRPKTTDIIQPSSLKPLSQSKQPSIIESTSPPPPPPLRWLVSRTTDPKMFLEELVYLDRKKNTTPEKVPTLEEYNTIILGLNIFKTTSVFDSKVTLFDFNALNKFKTSLDQMIDAFKVIVDHNKDLYIRYMDRLSTLMYSTYPGPPTLSMRSIYSVFIESTPIESLPLGFDKKSGIAEWIKHEQDYWTWLMEEDEERNFMEIRLFKIVLVRIEEMLAVPAIASKLKDIKEDRDKFISSLPYTKSDVIERRIREFVSLTSIVWSFFHSTREELERGFDPEIKLEKASRTNRTEYEKLIEKSIQAAEKKIKSDKKWTDVEKATAEAELANIRDEQKRMEAQRKIESDKTLSDEARQKALITASRKYIDKTNLDKIKRILNEAHIFLITWNKYSQKTERARHKLQHLIDDLKTKSFESDMDATKEIINLLTAMIAKSDLASPNPALVLFDNGKQLSDQKTKAEARLNETKKELVQYKNLLSLKEKAITQPGIVDKKRERYGKSLQTPAIDYSMTPWWLSEVDSFYHGADFRFDPGFQPPGVKPKVEAGTFWDQEFEAKVISFPVVHERTTLMKFIYDSFNSEYAFIRKLFHSNKAAFASTRSLRPTTRYVTQYLGWNVPEPLSFANDAAVLEYVLTSAWMMHADTPKIEDLMKLTSRLQNIIFKVTDEQRGKFYNDCKAAAQIDKVLMEQVREAKAASIAKLDDSKRILEENKAHEAAQAKAQRAEEEAQRIAAERKKKEEERLKLELEELEKKEVEAAKTDIMVFFARLPAPPIPQSLLAMAKDIIRERNIK